MITDGLRPPPAPLYRVTLASTLSTIGGAAPRAVPDPSFEPRGQALGPLARSASTLHLGKCRPFTTAPFGKRSNVRVSWSGAGAAGSVIVNLVRRLTPPRSLLRSRLEYLTVNSTCSVVTAPAGAVIARPVAASTPQPIINLQRSPMSLLSRSRAGR